MMRSTVYRLKKHKNDADFSRILLAGNERGLDLHVIKGCSRISAHACLPVPIVGVP